MPVIVFAQFAGTSLWFASNAVLPNLILELGFSPSFLGFITIAIQGGFIIGTLTFSIFSIADRFSPVKVFLICSLLGALFNGLTIFSPTFSQMILLRVLTGFFLAGIYPVGMKIASDWHSKGLGKALGYLVGALVLGTSFPHLLTYLGGNLPWKFVMLTTSSLSIIGGLLLFGSVSDGPHRVKSDEIKFSMFLQLFKNKNFRAASFGYFGHMWELYTFWAFTPIILAFYISKHPNVELSVPLWSFFIISIGAITCAVGGHLSNIFGSKKIALFSLFISSISAIVIPFLFEASSWIFLFVMLLWGASVIPDSPQFSTLIAQSTDKKYIATGLTIANCIGFSITIISIQLVNLLWNYVNHPLIFLVVFIGPIFGLQAISRYNNMKFSK